MPTQRVDQLRVLLHQQLPHRQDHRRRLILGRLHRHEAHIRTPRRFDHRLGIFVVVLAALDERLDVLRRDQAHPMPQPRQPPAPVMRTAARFQHHLRRRQLGKERLDLLATQLTAQHRVAPFVHPTQCENMLRRIHGNQLKLRHGRPPLLGLSTTQQFGTRCRGAVHTNMSLLIATTKDVDGQPSLAMTARARRGLIIWTAGIIRRCTTRVARAGRSDGTADRDPDHG